MSEISQKFKSAALLSRSEISNPCQSLYGSSDPGYPGNCIPSSPPLAQRHLTMPYSGSGQTTVFISAARAKPMSHSEYTVPFRVLWC